MSIQITNGDDLPIREVARFAAHCGLTIETVVDGTYTLEKMPEDVVPLRKPAEITQEEINSLLNPEPAA